MNNNLYDWVFHYNPYEKKWRAVKRDNYNMLFSNFNSEDILKADRAEVLIEIISKTGGDPNKIKSLLNNGTGIESTR